MNRPTLPIFFLLFAVVAFALPAFGQDAPDPGPWDFVTFYQALALAIASLLLTAARFYLKGAPAWMMLLAPLLVGQLIVALEGLDQMGFAGALISAIIMALTTLGTEIGVTAGALIRREPLPTIGDRSLPSVK